MNRLVSESVLELILETRDKKIAKKEFITANGQMYAAISFPIFSNARVVGTVIYGRKINPLVKCEDAILLDNSELSFREQNQFVNKIIDLKIRNK